MAERTDTERLDWLHENLMELVAMTDSSGRNAFWAVEWWSEKWNAYRERNSENPDLRQAIDAAIDAEEKDDAD